jgi:hypothetical protein
VKDIVVEAYPFSGSWIGNGEEVSETLVQASSVAIAHLRQILEELVQASSCMLLTSGGSFWKDWLHKLQTYILWSSFIVSTWLHSESIVLFLICLPVEPFCA